MAQPKTACAVVGVAGRMGQRICQLMAASKTVQLAGATESEHSPYLGQTVKEALGLQGQDVPIVPRLADIRAPFDVIVDFTAPAVSMETVRFAAGQGTAAVIGTTGFSDEQLVELRDLSGRFPCVCAPNMSLGVNALFKLVAEAAAILREGYDAEIVEIHHRHKKDAPSGTALRLAQIIADAYGRDLAAAGRYERKGIIGERPAEEIGIQTLRAGDVVGEHTVLFGGIGERLELVHKAQSRDCFVQGALVAAGWITGQPPGLYDMQDVLGLRT